MRLYNVAFMMLVVGGIACGGRRGSAASAPAPGSAAGAGSGKDSGGSPAWVTRGSVASTSEDGRRIFYGVAAASGIKNPALLRSTADNRARAELAKVFEVFSASLMKDYMNSAGDQNVEQAVKTFTSMSLEGTEVVDRYIESDGTMYSLAQLDLKKVMEGVRKAKELGAVKSYVQKVDVDDIFDAHAKKPAPVAAPERVAADSSTQSEIKPTSSSGKTKSGAKPAWVEGADPNYPARQWLCGVGFAKDRSAAENGSYASLSRIFVAHVASVSKDFMGAYSATGAQSLEVQSSEVLTKVATEKVFTGVEPKEVWQDKDSTVYALACLNRPKQARVLQEQIAELDTKAGKYLQAAESADKLGRVGQLARALEAIMDREVVNAELRIVDPDGVGDSGPYSHADVAAALEGAQDALAIGVQVLGRYEDDFRVAFVQALTKRGYKVTDLSDGDPGNLDVLICANIRIEDEGKGLGDAAMLSFARAVVLGEVKQVSQGKIIGSFDEKKREGHRNLDEAERKAVRGLGTIISNKAGAKIDQAMKAGAFSGAPSGKKVTCGAGPAETGRRNEPAAPPAASAAPAAPPKSGPSPSRAGLPAEDRHWVQPDDYFIADNAYTQSWMRVSLAKMVTQPNATSKGEAEFFNLPAAKNDWTSHYWTTRLAEEGDVRVGSLIICFEGNPRDGTYHTPTDKHQARPGAWFMGRVTDTSDMYKGVVQVSGYQCAPDALRVPEQG